MKNAMRTKDITTMALLATILAILSCRELCLARNFSFLRRLPFV